MKIISKIIIVFSLLALLSCDGYLDITQPSIYTSKNLYKTPGDCEAAIAGVYSQLQDTYNRNYLEVLLLRGDDIKNKDNISRFLDTSSESGWNNAYKALWVLVSRSNILLENINRVEFTDEKQKEYMKGEAYAMRGLAYLQFAWCWGGVPLITAELPLADLRKIARSSQEDTYKQAIADFKLAYDLLPETRTGTNLGRVTKYAAAGMLGRTYMYMHDYPNAANWLGEVIAKEGEPYKMANVYIDCFDDKFDNTGERVWEVQYIGGSSGQNAGVSQKYSSIFIQSTINLAHDGPLLYGLTFMGPSGSVQASVNIWTDGVYETSDLRREATIINGLWYDKVNEPKMDMYTIRKFLKASGTKPSAQDEWGNNLPILRYTDVKMMYAEALNEINYGGNINTILSILNEVRKRAGLANIDATTLSSKEITFDYIVKERFIEFCYEGIRWPDLIRWGKAEEAMKKRFSYKDESFNEVTQQPMYSMDKRNWLAPIPISEINSYNDKSVMWQNDGY